MQHVRNLSGVIATAAALFISGPIASAEDALKLMIAPQRAWDSAVPELGQQAGIFKKHGVVLDLQYAEDGADVEQPVISGAVDVGLGSGIMGVLRAYAKGGAPLRIIGASTTGSASYWYVLSTSSVKAIKDIAGKTIAYPTGGELNRFDVFDLMDRYRVKARPVPMASAAATLNSVMSGRIDVGWATAPFGVDAIEQGQIRVIVRGNDVPKIRDRTARVMITNAATLQKRAEILARFLEAYRETLAWMYSDSDAPKRYAEFAGVSEAFARRLRDEFFTKDILSPNNIMGFNAIVKDAVTLKYIAAPLSKKQVTELVQIPASEGVGKVKSIGGWFRAFSPASP